MTAKNKLRVFVSHASSDTPFAEKLFDYLEANGCDPWLDTQKLAAGVRWDELIHEEMHHCDVIVVLLLAGAITKEGYIQREFRLALRIAEEKLSNSPFLIPICLDSCKIPTALAEYQWLDVRDLEFEDKLFKSLALRATALQRRALTPQFWGPALDRRTLGSLHPRQPENIVTLADLPELAAIE